MDDEVEEIVNCCCCCCLRRERDVTSQCRERETTVLALNWRDRRGENDDVYPILFSS
jgi:hypothetical protein